MRAPSRIAPALLALASVACGSPAMAPLVAAPLVAEAVPLVAEAVGPQVLAAPNEDGSVYVLAEGGPLTSPLKLRSMWRHKATEACDGDYMVMSERDAQARRAGIVSAKLYEGFVRCVSPEGAVPK